MGVMYTFRQSLIQSHEGFLQRKVECGENRVGQATVHPHFNVLVIFRKGAEFGMYQCRDVGCWIRSEPHSFQKIFRGNEILPRPLVMPFEN